MLSFCKNALGTVRPLNDSPLPPLLHFRKAARIGVTVENRFSSPLCGKLNGVQPLVIAGRGLRDGMEVFRWPVHAGYGTN